jgi:hypothetical protein
MFYPLNKYIKIYNNKDNKTVILNNKYGLLNGLAIKENIKNNMDTIIQFEKDQKKDTIILDNRAALYHLPQNKYYKDYDLFNKGNFGYNGETRLIRDIEKNCNTTIYLISMDTLINLKAKEKYNQTPEKILDYVMNNYKRTGQVGFYYIYEKNN